MTDSDNNTALHVLCQSQNLEVLHAMIEKGVDINIRDKYGNNAMWTAVLNCKGRNYEFVEILIKLNPDITTKNNAGRSTLDFVKQINNTKLMDILTSK